MNQRSAISKGYKKNKLQQLRGFCAVIEEGTVQKASEKMNTAQSNVSLQIASLERDLKVTLFQREKQRLTPTPEALKLYKICKKSIEEIDFIFSNAMEAIKYDHDNTIKLAGHFYMLSHILPPYFKKALDKNKNLKFELFNSSYSEALDMLNTGNVDIAIYPASKQDDLKNIEVYEFYKCTFGIGMAKEHPLANVPENEITWDMLAKYDYITIREGITTQGLKTALESRGISSKFKLHNGTWEICMGMVREGLAIGGGDMKYANGAGIIAKECPSLMPQYQFHILVNKSFKISKSSKDLLKILGVKKL